MSKTEDIIEATHENVRRYMPGVGKQLLWNYAILMFGTLFLNILGLTVLLQFVQRPIANTIAFGLSLVWLIYGWRYLEGRNHATALFVLYTRYSRERRDLLRLQESADAPDSGTGAMEEAAQRFIDAAQAEHVPPREAEYEQHR